MDFYDIVKTATSNVMDSETFDKKYHEALTNPRIRNYKAIDPISPFDYKTLREFAKAFKNHYPEIPSPQLPDQITHLTLDPLIRDIDPYVLDCKIKEITNNLFLVGNVGTGKTTQLISLYIAHSLIFNSNSKSIDDVYSHRMRKYSTLYLDFEDISKLSGWIEKEYGNERLRERFNYYYDLIFIDDLLYTTPNQECLDYLISFISNQYKLGAKFICTCNADSKESLQEYLSAKLGKRIWDRIKGKVVEYNGESYRG